MGPAFDSIERLLSIEEEEAVWRSSVKWGDRLTIITLNSVYTLVAIGDDSFLISGGWFDRQNASPAIVKVAGCTCGGAVINRQLLAAPGLHLELGNRVVTTQIQKAVHERFSAAPSMAPN